MMNNKFEKYDASLISALEDIADGSREDKLAVFIWTLDKINQDQADYLKNIGGINDLTLGRDIFTAELTSDKINTLSVLDWIRYISLAQRLNPYKP